MCVCVRGQAYVCMYIFVCVCMCKDTVQIFINSLSMDLYQLFYQVPFTLYFSFSWNENILSVCL